MTKKEKLINWANEKFKNDEEGIVILLRRTEQTHNDNYDTPYMVTDIQNCYDFNELLNFVLYYSDRLVHIAYEKPEPNEEFYDYELEDYKRNKERLERYGINMEDMCISDYFWKSSEDIKYFEEE